MARKFNGTTDRASAAWNLSPYSVITLSFWLWWDVNSNNDDLAFETGTLYTNSSGFIVDPNNSVASNTTFIGMGLADGSIVWTDRFTRPSAAVWHHWMIVFNRATPANFVWIDGAVQTLTTQTHTAGTYGNFGNFTTNFMCRNQASLFGAGRMAEVAIWGGVALGTAQAVALATGATPPHRVRPDSLFCYAPLFGQDSPEPDYSGGQKSVTIGSGTTAANHPGVQAGLIAA